MKRSVNSAEINQNDANIGFEYGDVKYVFIEGNILSVKDGAIAEKKLIVDFVRRPADTYRRLQAAVKRLMIKDDFKQRQGNGSFYYEKTNKKGRGVA